MMRYLTHFILPVVCFLAVVTLKGQGPGESFDQTQIITGDRSLSLEKAFKITDMPNTVDIPVTMGDLKYQLIPRRPTTNIQVDPIEPARIKVREPLEPLYKGFVKGGAGTYATPYLEAYYTSLRDRDMAYGAHVKHLSSNQGIRNVAFSGFSENSVSVWGKKIFKEHSLQSKVGFDRDVVHYYGFDPRDMEIDKDDIRQRFNTITLENKWKSYYRDSSRVNHDLGLNFYYLNDRFNSSELGILATGDLRAHRGEHNFRLNTGFDFLTYKADGLSPFEFLEDTTGLSSAGTDTTNAILYAVPTILLRSGELMAKVGLGLYGQFSQIARFHAFPEVEVSYSLFDNIFVPYFGINGRVQRTSFRSITGENPFVLSQIQLENSIVRFNLFGGIRGSISDKISFNAQVGYDRTDNTPLFVNDTLFSSENRFQVIYDRVSTFRLMGEINYQNDEKWNAGLRGEIFSYSTRDEDEAWHLPSFRFTFLGGYNLFDKLELGVQMALIGERNVKSYFPVQDLDPETSGYTKVKLDPYFDMTLTAQYRYTSRLTVFVEGHNLTASKYDIYYRFPAQRAFILGGLKYAF
jgi:hypothetical protein